MTKSANQPISEQAINKQPTNEEEDEEYEDDDEEEEGEYETESAEEEIEPQLKYQRLGGSLQQIFSKENANVASALAVSDKFLVNKFV